jgi:hypothetical protein
MDIVIGPFAMPSLWLFHKKSHTDVHIIFQATSDKLLVASLLVASLLVDSLTRYAFSRYA